MLCYVFCSAPGTYVVFGRPGGEAVELSEVQAGRGGFAIHGVVLSGGSQPFVSSAGDVNGDGLADLIVGAPDADPGGRNFAGETYVVFGKPDGAPVDLSQVEAGQGGFAIRGITVEDRSGASVSGPGDVNGDGLPDLLVASCNGADRYSLSGAAYVVFGPAEVRPHFLRGDCNGDGTIRGVTDPVFLLRYNFTGGPKPPCLSACDAKGDGRAEGQVTDAVYLLAYNFLGGPPPPAPFPDCGPGTETDRWLECESPPTDCP